MNANFRPKIAVAYDEAFSFYYEDNFDLLREAGADIVFFSPLADSGVPEEALGLYLGGGFPEVFAGRLAQNKRMMESVRLFHQMGKPIYAECGGLIYLSERVLGNGSFSHEMVGLIPGNIRMRERLQSFGYKEIETAIETFLFPAGIQLRSHEFHYSEWLTENRNFISPYRIQGEPHGFFKKNLIASYQHLHFGTRPDMAQRWVDFIQMTCSV